MKKIIFFILLALPVGSSAYSSVTTHPALTSEIANYYNLLGGGLTQEQIGWMMEGSKEEDIPPRWINHFYNPIDGSAWTGDKAGDVAAEEIRRFSTAAFYSAPPKNVLDWMIDDIAQQEMRSYGGNHSWVVGIRNYADGKNQQDSKKTEESFKTLGHILHLLEDMAVPEHTRDDTHAGVVGEVTGDAGSPYEKYASAITGQVIRDLKIPEELAKGISYPKYNNPQDYLRNLAAFTNANFFSKDTINDERFDLPKIVDIKDGYAWGFEGGEIYRLASCDKKNSEVLQIDGDSSLVHQDYFVRLAPKAIWYGAGLVDLYLKEAEEEAVNREFNVSSKRALGEFAFSILPPNWSLTGALSVAGRFMANLGGIIGATESDPSSQTQPGFDAKALLESFQDSIKEPQLDNLPDLKPSTYRPSVIVQNSNPVNLSSSQEEPAPVLDIAQTPEPNNLPAEEPSPILSPTPSPLPFYGGGGSGVVVAQNESVESAPTLTAPENQTSTPTSTIPTEEGNSTSTVTSTIPIIEDTTPTSTSTTSPLYLEGTFNKGSMLMNLSWQAMEGATSYEVSEISSDSPIVIGAVGGLTIGIGIQEVGRDYKYQVRALGGGGEELDRDAKVITAPDFISNPAFWNHPEDGLVVDISYEDYPFIPDVCGLNEWQGIVLYRNRAPNLSANKFYDPNYSPDPSVGAQQLYSSLPYIVAFTTQPRLAPGHGPGLLSTSFLLPGDNKHLRLRLVREEDWTPAESDYILPAYYSSCGMRGDYGLQLVGYSGKKIFFSNVASPI